IQKEIIYAVVKDQRAELVLPQGTVPRELAGKIAAGGSRTACIVKGVRRCGKSTLLKQLLLRWFGEKFFYVNFDDERLAGFEASDFQKLMEVFIGLCGNQKALLLDEAQNVKGWELFVNRMLREGYFVFLTGSNADLLSKELGTHLTGRHLDYQLYPFSFGEFLLLKNVGVENPDALATAQRAEIADLFKVYLEGGGMPEYALGGEEALLGQVVEDIVQKDIVKRYAIRKPNELRSVLKFLISNSGNRITFNGLAKHFGIKSPVTTRKYVGYAEETYLLFLVEKYERKLKLLDKNPKKAYCVDNGIISRLSYGLSRNVGFMLESLAAVELKRRGEKFFYYVNANGTETDFVILNGAKKITSALQVCTDVVNTDTAQREEKALLQTMEATGLREGTVLTLEHWEEKKIKGKTLRYVPAWKWLLGKG
ncbi:ATP-binding protein, partial [Candidatus Micrarchaeota archaeon]|nr:ATP-binding protein [Candidatus Micrarchaeota archaeon]